MFKRIQIAVKQKNNSDSNPIRICHVQKTSIGNTRRKKTVCPVKVDQLASHPDNFINRPSGSFEKKT